MPRAGNKSGKSQTGAKPVYEVCAKTQRILRQYDSLTTAALQLGMHKSSLRNILIQRRVLEGSYFRYATAVSAPTSPEEPANVLPACATRAASSRHSSSSAGGSISAGNKRIAVFDSVTRRVQSGRAAPQAYPAADVYVHLPRLVAAKIPKRKALHAATEVPARYRLQTWRRKVWSDEMVHQLEMQQERLTKHSSICSNNLGCECGKRKLGTVSLLRLTMTRFSTTEQPRFKLPAPILLKVCASSRLQR